MRALRAMGKNTTKDELLNFVLEVDIGGNGTIQFDEFPSMMKQKVIALQPSFVKSIVSFREAFKIFDRMGLLI